MVEGFCRILSAKMSFPHCAPGAGSAPTLGIGMQGRLVCDVTLAYCGHLLVVWGNEQWTCLSPSLYAC